MAVYVVAAASGSSENRRAPRWEGGGEVEIHGSGRGTGSQDGAIVFWVCPNLHALRRRLWMQKYIKGWRRYSDNYDVR